MADRVSVEYDGLMVFLALLSCATAPDVRPAFEPPPCDDPGFERLEIPGEGVDRHRFVGSGLAVADLTGDGHADLLLAGPHSVRLLVGPDLAEDPGALPDRDFSDTVGAAAADADGDGDLDVLITRFGPPDVLLVNRGDGTFADGTGPVVGVPGHSQSAAWADVDADGDLDLAIAGHGPIDDSGDTVVIPGPADPTRLLLNEGDGTFADATDRLPERIRDAYTFVVTFSDLDGDHLPDLYQANDWPVYEVGLAALNRGESLVLAPELGLDLRAAGMGMGVADSDGDGVDDFLVPAWDQVVYLRSSGERWVDFTASTGLRPPSEDLAYVGWGADWGDLDNDADLDAMVVFGHLDPLTAFGATGGTTENAARQRDVLFERMAPGQFEERAEAWGLDEDGVGRGIVIADLNADGALDVVRRDLDGPTVVNLSRCAPASWLVVRPMPPARAIGAKVVVEVLDQRQTRTIRAGGTGLASSGPPEAHFGLGASEVATGVEVHWPDGEVDAFDLVLGRQVLEVW